MTTVQTSTALPLARLDGCAFGWRFSAVTRAADGDGPGANDDAWIVRQSSNALDLAVIDVATQKRGVVGADIQSAIADTFASASDFVSPAELVAAAHARLRQLLRARDAIGVACLLVVRLAADGSACWAHAGDAVLIRWRPSAWLRPSTTRLLNTRHRRGHGLTQCVGTRSEVGPLLEEGSFVAFARERLLLATDGVFHDEMTLPPIGRWVDAHERHRHVFLTSDLCSKVETEARSFQPAPDDTSLIVAERLGRLE